MFRKTKESILMFLMIFLSFFRRKESLYSVELDDRKLFVFARDKFFVVDRCIDIVDFDKLLGQIQNCGGFSLFVRQKIKKI